MTGYVATLQCTRQEADYAALADEPFLGFEPQPSLAAAETEEGWELRLYTEHAPSSELLATFVRLALSSADAPVVQALGDEDWVTLSQEGLEPVNIGRFHIYTAERRGEHNPGQWPIRIDAGLAFGTGQHATTAGCIAMAGQLAGKMAKRNILDVGTGSGVLALAAHKLFPKAAITAADLDGIAAKIAEQNVRLNAGRIGRGRGEFTVMQAAGVEHQLIARRAPYDLVFANILAGPLVALAPSISGTVAQGGHLILAGLLQPQATRVIAAYQAQGLRLISRSPRSEWPVLLFRKIKAANVRAATRSARRETASRGWQIDTL